MYGDEMTELDGVYFIEESPSSTLYFKPSIARSTEKSLWAKKDDINSLFEEGILYQSKLQQQQVATVLCETQVSGKITLVDKDEAAASIPRPTIYVAGRKAFLFQYFVKKLATLGLTVALISDEK